MVRMIRDGDPSTPWDVGWYARQDITCPRCSAVFRLDESDFLGTLPIIGFNLNHHPNWLKIASNQVTLTPSMINPEQVQGLCPYCGFFDIVIRGPGYGFPIRAQGDHDPALGVIQAAWNAGARLVRFVRRDEDGLLVAILLNADGTFYNYHADDTSQAVVKNATTGFYNGAYRFPTGARRQPLFPSEAFALDIVLYNILGNIGFTIIN